MTKNFLEDRVPLGVHEDSPLQLETVTLTMINLPATGIATTNNSQVDENS